MKVKTNTLTKKQKELLNKNIKIAMSMFKKNLRSIIRDRAKETERQILELCCDDMQKDLNLL